MPPLPSILPPDEEVEEWEHEDEEKVVDIATTTAITHNTKTSLRKPSYPRLSNESVVSTTKDSKVEGNSDIFTSPRAQKGEKGLFARKKKEEEEKAQLPQLVKDVFELLDDNGVEMGEASRAHLRDILGFYVKKNEGVVRG